MNGKAIKLIILGLLSALFILSSGMATAENEDITEVVKIGTDVTVTENQVLTEAVAIGGSVTILEGGRVTQDATAIGGDVILEANAQVGGNAVAIAGSIVKADSAIVNGDEVEILSGATDLVKQLGLFGTLYLGSVIFNVASILVIIAFGIFLLLLLPGHLNTIAETMSQHPFKSAMWGLGAMILVILVTGLIGGSVLGFLLIPIINLALAVTGLLGCVTTGLWVGQQTPLGKDGARIKPFLLGMVILGVISIIPVAGGLIVLMVTLFGFGAVLLSRVGTVLPESIGKQFDQLEGRASSSEI
ncbi:hypothetical protein PCC7418_3803 [Halothece sp. PCC 7418]|uniref:hypothetical protein n=1 Tax=Halothece sp. (strain PCC 7418) TaxID=65093 RepID=UPI0002A08050|nr:hypothetical protein [Halothece sp. PCC 7418]AFZ45907.1 hypothetical protein PCC7418_3803 [Halothece sp. PCC 7418]